MSRSSFCPDYRPVTTAMSPRFAPKPGDTVFVPGTFIVRKEDASQVVRVLGYSATSQMVVMTPDGFARYATPAKYRAMRDIVKISTQMSFAMSSHAQRVAQAEAEAWAKSRECFKDGDPVVTNIQWMPMTKVCLPSGTPGSVVGTKPNKLTVVEYRKESGELTITCCEPDRLVLGGPQSLHSLQLDVEAAIATAVLELGLGDVGYMAVAKHTKPVFDVAARRGVK